MQAVLWQSADDGRLLGAVDDVEVGKRTIIAAMRQTNDQNIGRISYKNFNSIQKVREWQ